MNLYQFIYIAGLLCAILEIFTTSFILLGFSIGFFVVGITQQILKSANFNRDVLIFAIVSAISIFVFRKLFAGKNDVEYNDTDINQY